MIDLNFTVIFQLAIILILMIALADFLFKPFIGVVQGRRDWVEGAERKARELQQRMEELMERYRDAIAAAQAQGANLREGIRKESLAREMEILRKASEEAGGFLEEMKKKIREETELARATLRLQAQNLSRQIAEKILGRAIQ
jgi:F0F1-type ATP synthase membrane subunit b/b'